jgi:hypothetical protein
METIQRASGARIETRNIRDAKATPHSMSAGQSQRVSVVAPAREVNAAVASRPQTRESSPVQGGQKQHKSDVNQTAGRAVPESQQGSPQTKHQEQKAAKLREAPPVQAHDQTPSSSSHGQNAHKAPAHVEAPPPPSGQQHHEAAPAQGRSESMTQPAHHQAPAHAHQPPPPNQAKNPAGKDKKAEQGKKDEKGEGPSAPKEPIRL